MVFYVDTLSITPVNVYNFVVESFLIYVAGNALVDNFEFFKRDALF